jgi:hypothetical protein
MSISAEEVFVIDFDDRYKLAYQGKGKLRNSVTVRGNVVGKTAEFNKYGQGIMTEFNRGNDVVAVNADQSKVTATIVDYVYSEYVFITDVNKMIADEKQAIAESAGMATGRREDQLIIDAITTAIAVGTFPSAQKINYNTGANQAKMSVTALRAVMKIMDDNEVEENDRYALLAPQQIADLLAVTEVTSSDYNVVKTLVSGQVNSFLGFTFFKMGTRTEGGVPVPFTSNYNAYFWQKRSIGLAIGQDKMTEINYVPEKLAYLFSCVYCAGAVVIDTAGVVSYQTGTA